MGADPDAIRKEKTKMVKKKTKRRVEGDTNLPLELSSSGADTGNQPTERFTTGRVHEPTGDTPSGEFAFSTGRHHGSERHGDGCNGSDRDAGHLDNSIGLQSTDGAGQELDVVDLHGVPLGTTELLQPGIQSGHPFGTEDAGLRHQLLYNELRQLYRSSSLFDRTKSVDKGLMSALHELIAEMQEFADMLQEDCMDAIDVVSWMFAFDDCWTQIVNNYYRPLDRPTLFEGIIGEEGSRPPKAH